MKKISIVIIITILSVLVSFAFGGAFAEDFYQKGEEDGYIVNEIPLCPSVMFYEPRTGDRNFDINSLMGSIYIHQLLRYNQEDGVFETYKIGLKYMSGRQSTITYFNNDLLYNATPIYDEEVWDDYTQRINVYTAFEKFDGGYHTGFYSGNKWITVGVTRGLMLGAFVPKQIVGVTCTLHGSNNEGSNIGRSPGYANIRYRDEDGNEARIWFYIPKNNSSPAEDWLGLTPQGQYWMTSSPLAVNSYSVDEFSNDYQSGYNSGYNTGLGKYNTSYNSGYNAGYTAGENSGKQLGYSEYMAKYGGGSAEGLAKIWEVVKSVAVTIYDMVKDFLSYNIFGLCPIYAIVALIILVYIIRYFLAR